MGNYGFSISYFTVKIVQFYVVWLRIASSYFTFTGIYQILNIRYILRPRMIRYEGNIYFDNSFREFYL